MPTLILSNPLGADDAQRIGLEIRAYAVGEQITVNDFVFATLIRTGYGLPYGTVEDILLIGDGSPTADTGLDGQWYLDRLNEVLWGPKVGGYWPDDPVRPDRGVQQLRLDGDYHLILTYSTGTVVDLGNVKGDKGDTGTFEVGAVTAVAPGQPARVENVGTPEHGILEFDLPQGVKGDRGAPGEGYGGGLVTAGGDPANPLNAVITSNWGLRDDGSTYYDPAGALPAEAALLMPDADVGGFALFRPGGPTVTLTADRVRDIVLDPDGAVMAGLQAEFASAGELDTAVQTAQIGQPNGVAGLDAGGRIPSAQLPALAITDTFPVSDETEMLALTAQVGDVAIRADGAGSFILRAEPASTLGNWSQLATPGGGAVRSVDGMTGDVALGSTAATADTLARRTATGTLVVANATANGEALTLGQSLSFARDRGTGTALPSTDLRRGDTYYHTGVGCLMAYNGAAWRQDGITAVAADADRDALVTNYAAALHDGFLVYVTVSARVWVRSGTAWKPTDTVDTAWNQLTHAPSGTIWSPPAAWTVIPTLTSSAVVPPGRTLDVDFRALRHGVAHNQELQVRILIDGVEVDLSQTQVQIAGSTFYFAGPRLAGSYTNTTAAARTVPFSVEGIATVGTPNLVGSATNPLRMRWRVW